MHMNDETTEAWEECKIHWDKLAAGDKDEPIGEHACAFCRRFSTRSCTEPKTAERCPIYRAGYMACSGTAYLDAESEHWRSQKYPDIPTTNRKRMRDFIYDLPNKEPRA